MQTKETIIKGNTPPPLPQKTQSSPVVDIIIAVLISIVLGIGAIILGIVGVAALVLISIFIACGGSYSGIF